MCTGASTFAPTPFRPRASTPTPRVQLAAGATESARKRSRPCAPALFPAATTPASMRPRHLRRGRRARTRLRCARWGWRRASTNEDAASTATACARARLCANRMRRAARRPRARTLASTPPSASSPVTTITTTPATCRRIATSTEHSARRAAQGRSSPTLTWTPSARALTALGAIPGRQARRRGRRLPPHRLRCKCKRSACRAPTRGSTWFRAGRSVLLRAPRLQTLRTRCSKGLPRSTSRLGGRPTTGMTPPMHKSTFPRAVSTCGFPTATFPPSSSSTTPRPS